MFGAKISQKTLRSGTKGKGDVYQQLFQKVFLRLKLGQLCVVCPSGETMVFGQGEEIKAQITVLDQDFFRRCVLFGDIGFGESYVDGQWETDDITKVIEWMILNVENHPTMMADRARKQTLNWLKLFNQIAFKLKPNSIKGSQKNIAAHYDLSNNLFETFLDRTMMYSSAYFKSPDQPLEEAQKEKVDRLCHKLRLKNTDHLLEIGTGWGYCAIHAAKNYGCKVKTITISKEQYHLAKERVHKEGLSDQIDVELIDYRHVRGHYDKIISIEMIEAVGHKYFPEFFARCHKLLKKEGLLGLQMILAPDNRYESFRKNVDWIQKHIFPGSLLPSLKVIQQSMNATGDLCLYNYEDITRHYVQTLQGWRERFNGNLQKVLGLGFDHQFIRKWHYYLSYCEAAFAMRNISVAQAIYSRPNNLQV